MDLALAGSCTVDRGTRSWVCAIGRAQRHTRKMMHAAKPVTITPINTRSDQSYMFPAERFPAERCEGALDLSIAGEIWA